VVPGQPSASSLAHEPRKGNARAQRSQSPSALQSRCVTQRRLESVELAIVVEVRLGGGGADVGEDLRVIREVVGVVGLSLGRALEVVVIGFRVGVDDGHVLDGVIIRGVISSSVVGDVLGVLLVHIHRVLGSVHVHHVLGSSLRVIAIDGGVVSAWSSLGLGGLVTLGKPTVQRDDQLGIVVARTGRRDGGRTGSQSGS
jgi:hypothetical protein